MTGSQRNSLEKFNKNIGILSAYKKITAYCAYQERCHSEVKEKLYSYGLYKDEVDELMSRLIVENFLDEERFALAFARGKFRMKKWGKVKIRYELKSRGVSEYCIKKALASLDQYGYTETLQQLAEEIKLATAKEKNHFKRKAKIQAWLLRKGFERDLIKDHL